MPDTGQAIAIAVGTMKRWAVDPHRSPSVRARASEALAHWEAARAAAHGEDALKHAAKAVDKSKDDKSESDSGK